MNRNARSALHRAYQVGVILKGIDGVLEVLGGLALLLISQGAIGHVVVLLTQAELGENPHDFIANLLVHRAQHLSAGTQHFAGFYLLGHGLVKVGLVAGLLRGLRGSYPVALLLLTAFIGYQVYRLTRIPSILLLAFTAIDVLIVALIWREWKRVRLGT